MYRGKGGPEKEKRGTKNVDGGRGGTGAGTQKNTQSQTGVAENGKNEFKDLRRRKITTRKNENH